MILFQNKNFLIKFRNRIVFHYINNVVFNLILSNNFILFQIHLFMKFITYCLSSLNIEFFI